MRILRSVQTLLFSIIVVAALIAAAEAEEDYGYDDNHDGTNTNTNPDCRDNHEKCSEWTSLGECENNPNYMLRNCKFSCNNCFGERDDPLVSTDPKDYKDHGSDLGVEQQLSYYKDGTNQHDIQFLISKTRNYMNHFVKEEYGSDLVKSCKNLNKECAYWALLGDCETEYEYMFDECAPVCGFCHYIDKRCPVDDTWVDTWKKGDLNRLFRKLTSEPYKSKYEVEILSSPNNKTIDNEKGGGPWVITMENVITDQEAVRLIELGHIMEYEQSTTVGKVAADGSYKSNTISGRTSLNAWCNEEECLDDEHVIDVVNRLEFLTGIPQTNSEHLQLLKYEPTQFYKSHHDYIAHHKDKQGGPRILTFFLYLNEGFEGGETYFDDLDISVTPKRGRAVVWPNVKNSDPSKKDKRTKHQALPVISGVKYGANAWMHLRDFKTANENDCMGEKS